MRLVSDVLLQGNESILVLVDVIQRFLNDDVLHVLRFFGVEKIRKFRLWGDERRQDRAGQKPRKMKKRLRIYNVQVQTSKYRQK